MLDFGIVAKEETEDYNTKFLSELIQGEEITGEIVVGEFKPYPWVKEKWQNFILLSPIMKIALNGSVNLPHHIIQRLIIFTVRREGYSTISSTV